MEDSNNLFLTIDFRIQGAKSTTDCCGAHINNYPQVKSSKYLIAGGFLNKNNGTLVFKARNLEEAKQVVNNNALINNNLYQYELLKYDLLTLPHGA